MTSTTQLTGCTTQPSTVALQRVNFFNRQLLTADDMTADRDYFLAKLRRHNRFLHGCGVVCGLVVAPPAAPTATTPPWLVGISSGYALGPYGDEIFVGETVNFDLAQCASGGMTSPCEPSAIVSGAAGTSSTVYLAIKYAECLARPVQVASSGCGCDSDPCQYSRIRDSFQIQCLSQLPAQPAPPSYTFCQAMQNPVLATCPPCPTNPWVVLAQITLPTSPSTSVTSTMIDNVSYRKVILSSALLQAQVYQCCCGSQSTATLSIQETGQSVRAAGTADQTWSITVTVTNNSTTLDASNVVVTVNLSANPSGAGYTVNPGDGWTTAEGTSLNNPASLTSTGFPLPSGETYALNFQIIGFVPTLSTQFDVTSVASASASGFTGAPYTFNASFGRQNVGSTS
jgi:hypothetical protein